MAVRADEKASSSQDGASAEGQPVQHQEYNLASEHDQLARGLKSRHIQFLALGGAIGTGLFIGSGAILHDTG